ncbi:hypothetical protein NHX12_003480 [Muraenolepis orangiensis]|uniref:Uncharacterized protein n=1 Tax=Muraenolepis orangiensis TaxID=630683 RepID=A0A9Q0E1H0_9TELE|nr:hypothetical protein NHX12_003480 [Muraenolepis orangiensis]
MIRRFPLLTHHFLIWSFTSSRSINNNNNNYNNADHSPCRGEGITSSGEHQMSKRDKAGKKGRNGKNPPRCPTETPATSHVVLVPVTRDRTGAVMVSVRAKPGAKHNAITDVSSDAVGVAIAAAPTDGEANAELLWYLAQVLQLKKSQLLLDKGSRSRNKTVTVGSSLSPEEVLHRLKEAAS